MPVFKPQTPIINWGNPITKNLLIDIPIFERTPNMVTETVSRRKSNAIAGTPTAYVGPPGAGIKFSSYLDRVDFPDTTAWDYTSNITSFQCIFSLDSYPDTTEQFLGYLWSDENNTVTTATYRIGSGGLSANQKRISVAFSTSAEVKNNTDLALSTVYNLIITTDGTNAKFYLNGLLDTTVAYSTTPSNQTENWYIGSWNGGSANGRTMFGKIYLIRRWNNRALTPNEVKQLYVNPWQIYASPNFRNYFNSNSIIASQTPWFSNSISQPLNFDSAISV